MISTSECVEFIRQRTDWRTWYPTDDLAYDIEWINKNGIVIGSYLDGQLSQLGAYVPTAGIELDVSRMISSVLGGADAQGDYLLCVFYVKKDPGLIPINDLKKIWLMYYPNVKTLYYKKLKEDSKLVKCPIVRGEI